MRITDRWRAVHFDLGSVGAVIQGISHMRAFGHTSGITVLAGTAFIVMTGSCGAACPSVPTAIVTRLYETNVAVVCALFAFILALAAFLTLARNLFAVFYRLPRVLYALLDFSDVSDIVTSHIVFCTICKNTGVVLQLISLSALCGYAYSIVAFDFL